jgi:Heparinase II/III-like protein
VHFRGTAAHNTVCVDGRQQTRYLPKPIKDTGSRHAGGSVRHKISGPAPEAVLLERWHGAQLDLLHGRARSHEYDALHERCIVFVDRCYWIVSDALRAPTPHEYRLNFQLGAHAEGGTTLLAGAGVRVHSPGLLMLQPARHGIETALRPGWVSARYGHKQAAPAVQSTGRGHHADFDTVLLPWSRAEPAFSVEDVAVEATGSSDEPLPRALRMTRQVDGRTVIDTWFHARGCSADSWCIGGGLELRGRWALWQHSADGRLLRSISHAGASLAATSTKVAA